MRLDAILLRRVKSMMLPAFTMLFCGINQAQSVNQAQTDALVGIWRSEQVLSSPVRGELLLEARGAEWRANIGAFTAAVQRRGNEITFTLPGNQGDFRGYIKGDGASIDGHWIQPPGIINTNRYASPVHFSRDGKSRWKGQVIPLEERMSLYVSVQRAADGALTAFIRNPEFNDFRRRTFQVKFVAGNVELSSKGQTLKGQYDAKMDRLSLAAIEGAPSVLFTRRNHDDAIGLYPRTQPSAEYVYRQPPARNDGWATAQLSDVGMNATQLGQLVQKIVSADPADNPINIQSLLIARHGKLVLEEYFYGFDKDRPHDVRSAGKTLAPVLLGIARDHGAAVSPATPVYSMFPEYKSFANWDSRKPKLTVRDVMTMTSGLACDDNDDDSPGNEDNMQSQNKQPDWYKYTLDLPMASEPGGSHAVYCSADLNLVGGVVRHVTEKWLPQFFELNYARPLGIDRYFLNLMPTGEAYMGGGAYLLPRDQLKLGQLYLSGGLWNGRRVVSKEWVDESTKKHSTFPPNIKDEPEHDYGYGWHERNFIKVGDHVYRDYAAGGNGGQLVIVIPDLDMVVGINGGSYGDFRWYRWELDLLPQYIVPSAIGSIQTQTPN
jgi:CubicO group peptidase (beta-lactamase class C family)